LTLVFRGLYHLPLNLLLFLAICERQSGILGAAMTLRETLRSRSGSRRLRFVASACLAACATPKSAPDPELRIQIQALVGRQARLERKVELLESRLAVALRPKPESSAGGLIPKDLATLKLGPPSPRAPEVPTSIALREPDAAFVRAVLDEPSPEPDPLQAGGALSFDAGMESIRTGDVEGGAARLIAFADRHPRDERAPTALFTAGVGLFTSGEVAAAALVLERVSDDYPAAAEAPEATVHLAQCKLRLRNVEAAKATYAKVIDRYPKSRAAKAAEAELKSISDAPSGR
jgi:TolA-binding protein